MQPTKKQNNNSNKNEKQISEDTTTTKIKSYSKLAPKCFVATDESKKNPSEYNTKDFYI